MKITMIGHATLLIEVDGKRILTDPWLTEPLYFGQLFHTRGFAPPKLPEPDLLLVSHGHQDHFDPASLAKIPPRTPVVIHEGYAKAATRAGFSDVRPMKAGDSLSLDTVTITGMPGKHPGGITTFMIEGREGKVYFGGDSIHTPGLEQALAGSKPDVCLLPISGGGFGPMKFHMNAAEAARLAKASRAKTAIPIHYHFTLKNPRFNGFLGRKNSLEEFQAAMREQTQETITKTLDYNETWEV